MQVKDIQNKSAKRYKSPNLHNLGIQGYGDDNLYPENLLNIINSSATGAECVDRYADFLEGEGFNDIAFSEVVVNHHGETTDDLHSKICADIATYNGFALHLNYNIYGEVTEISHIPFECCRLCEADEWGYVNKIAIHQDWTGTKQVQGKTLAVNKKNIDYIFAYNPDKEITLSQIEACGGIENYNGQVLWVSLNGSFVYPTPKADRVITEMSTDEGLANVRWRNVRCNFLPSGLVVTRRGTISGLTQDGYTQDEAEQELEERSEAFSDALAKMQGDTKSNKIIECEIETDEEKPEFIPITTNNYDKEFTQSEASTAERIYAAFGQECFYLQRIGKVGFGGQVMQDAFALYNSSVNKVQRKIERVFKQLFSEWQGATYTDFSVKPKTYITNTINQEANGTSNNE